MRILAVVLLAGGLASCTLGPDYSRPPAPLPDHWKESVPADGELRGDWWVLFADPALTALVRKSLEANQTIAGAVARAFEAKALLRVASAKMYPTLELDPAAQRERAFEGFVSGTDGGVTRNLFALPLNLSYEVDLWGKVRRSVEASEATFQASIADRESIRLGVTSEVVQSWIMLRHVDLDRKLLRDTVDLRRQTLDLVQTRFRNGVANELEVSQSKIELAQAQSEAAGLERVRAELEHALAQLSGDPAPSVSFAEQPLDYRLPTVPVILPSELLERRPDIARAERQVAAANARIGQAQTAYFPSLNLAALVGFETVDLSHLFRRSNFIWSLGGSSSVPLFQGGATDATVELAKAEYVEAVAAYRQQVLVAFQEVEDALSALSALAVQAEAQADLLRAAELATTLARRRYEEGLASLLEVIDTQRSLLQARRSTNQVYRDRLLATVLLIRALGGGWTPGGDAPGR
jgi:multidrug efflux system outer membrane protein